MPLWVRLTIVPLGYLLARLPHFFRGAIASCLGWALYAFLKKRRRILLSNLHHAFPHWDRHKLRKTAKRSCAGVIEMGLLLITGPFLSPAWIRKNFLMTDRLRDAVDEQVRNPKPVLLLVPHHALFEAPLWLHRIYCDLKIGLVFRPLKQSGLSSFIEWSRAKSGGVLLSKKKGLTHAMNHLRQNQCLVIPFDQNAGPPGAGILFLDQLCAATNLPGSLASKYDAQVTILMPRRIRGWKILIDLHPFDCGKTPEAVTRATNDWLARTLREGENDPLCADWMWIHNRWKFQWNIRQCLSFKFKKSYLPESLPRKKRFFIRLPERVETIEDLVAFLRALRRSRSDAALTLTGSPRFFEKFGGRLDAVSESRISIPAENRRRFFRDLAHVYPDYWITLNEDPAVDREGVWMDIPFRLGWAYAKGERPQLTSTYLVEDPGRWQMASELQRWLTFATHFGLNTDRPE